MKWHTDGTPNTMAMSNKATSGFNDVAHTADDIAAANNTRIANI